MRHAAYSNNNQHFLFSGTVEHDLRGNSGRFATPNFPDKYKDNSKINWNITVDDGQKIQLTIHLMNVRIFSLPFIVGTKFRQCLDCTLTD